MKIAKHATLAPQTTTSKAEEPYLSCAFKRGVFVSGFSMKISEFHAEASQRTPISACRMLLFVKTWCDEFAQSEKGLAAGFGWFRFSTFVSNSVRACASATEYKVFAFQLCPVSWLEGACRSSIMPPKVREA